MGKFGNKLKKKEEEEDWDLKFEMRKRFISQFPKLLGELGVCLSLRS